MNLELSTLVFICCAFSMIGFIIGAMFASLLGMRDRDILEKLVDFYIDEDRR